MAGRVRAQLCLVALVAIALVPAGEAIRCYVCISTEDPNCGDPFSASDKAYECTPDVLKTLNVGQSYSDVISTLRSGLIDINDKFECQKRKTKRGSAEVVMRTCSLSTDVVNMCSHGDGEGITCTQCAEDLCNGGRALAAAAPLLAALLPALALALRP